MKKKLVSVLLSIFLLTGLTGCQNEEAGNSADTQRQEDAQTEPESGQIAQEENEDEDIGYCHKYFDTTKFDATKFSGIVYYVLDDQPYNVEDLLAESEDGCESLHSSYYRYSLEPDVSDDTLEYIKEMLGDPMCILEKYSDSEYGIIGDIGLIYDYGDYILVVALQDFTQWTSASAPDLVGIYAMYKSTWFSDNYSVSGVNHLWYDEHTVYGTELEQP